MPQNEDDYGAAVPTGRVARLMRFGGIGAGIAGSVAAGGISALAKGKRPDLAQLLLTPANTMRLTDGLSHLRGAALKLGQMLSMDTGLVLPGELTAILGRFAGNLSRRQRMREWIVGAADGCDPDTDGNLK